MSYSQLAAQLKALADPKRLQIIDMLSCQEMCACVILEAFAITQSTLSHHMKILCEANLVTERKEGKNIYYAINTYVFTELMQSLNQLHQPSADCICHQCTTTCA